MHFILAFVSGVTLVVLGIGSVSPALAASSGAESPAAASDDATIGTATWDTPANSLTSDDVWAGVTPAAVNAVSHYLIVSDFGFSVPSGATIDGIEVNIERHASQSDTIKDHTVTLVKAGSVAGSNKAVTASFWGTTDATAAYGADTDLWGTTWTAADINASGFGVAIAATTGSAGAIGCLFTECAIVDHISITVHYTEAAGASSSVSSSSSTASVPAQRGGGHRGSPGRGGTAPLLIGPRQAAPSSAFSSSARSSLPENEQPFGISRMCERLRRRFGNNPSAFELLLLRFRTRTGVRC